MMSAAAMGVTAVHGTGVELTWATADLRAGDVVDVQAEFTAFFRTEFPRVVRTVTLVLGDRGRAEEIAQDAFVQLFDHWRKVSRYELPEAWVRRVAIRMANRTAHREHRRRVLEDRAAPVETTPGLDTADADIYAAVRRLPLSQRTAVVLFYFEDRPVAEIADLLGCAPATARVHLHKARRRLAATLGGEVDDDV